MKKIWTWLNGNKTIICLGVTTILQQAVNIGWVDNTKGIQFVIGIGLTLGGGSMAHHIKKGYFSTKKGE